MVAAVALLAVSCGSSDSATVEPDTAAPAADDPAPEPEPAEEPEPEPAEEPEPEPTETPEPEPEPTETPEPEPEPEPEAEAIVIGDPDADGVITVSIDGAQLAPLFDDFIGGADPLYLIHTQQDDVFVGVELYTVFGAGWTGELGTFPTDCGTHGICVYLDPDGTGPLSGGGPGTGTVTISQLEGGSTVTIDEVTITADDGQVYRMSGVTLTG